MNSINADKISSILNWYYFYFLGRLSLFRGNTKYALKRGHQCLSTLKIIKNRDNNNFVKQLYSTLDFLVHCSKDNCCKSCTEKQYYYGLQTFLIIKNSREFSLETRQKASSYVIAYHESIQQFYKLKDMDNKLSYFLSKHNKNKHRLIAV